LVDPLKSQVLLTVPTVTYEALKKMIKEWALLKLTWTVKEVLPESRMEVDVTWKGKGPPKGKGKLTLPKGVGLNKGGWKGGKGPSKGKSFAGTSCSASTSTTWRPSLQQPGKGKGKFQGVCNRCGKIGHKARDCYARVSAIQQDESHPFSGTLGHVEQVIEEEQVEYLMAMTEAQMRQKILSEIVLLLIDSGAFEHVCPRNFADWFPLVELKNHPSVIAANGQQLEVFGERTIKATMLDNGHAKIKFKVMSVTRPILSVSRLASQGYQVIFNKNPCLVKGQKILKLYTHRGLYFLPVSWHIEGLCGLE
jgi:hypothetical protein